MPVNQVPSTIRLLKPQLELPISIVLGLLIQGSLDLCHELRSLLPKVHSDELEFFLFFNTLLLVFLDEGIIESDPK